MRAGNLTHAAPANAVHGQFSLTSLPRVRHPSSGDFVASSVVPVVYAPLAAMRYT
jgi:hypothetical protein